eukprot:jgi/Mesen1/10035/ME000073S09313
MKKEVDHELYQMEILGSHGAVKKEFVRGDVTYVVAELEEEFSVRLKTSVKLPLVVSCWLRPSSSHYTVLPGCKEIKLAVQAETAEVLLLRGILDITNPDHALLCKRPGPVPSIAPANPTPPSVAPKTEKQQGEGAKAESTPKRERVFIDHTNSGSTQAGQGEVLMRTRTKKPKSESATPQVISLS